MYNPFSDCSNLTSIVVEEGNPNYNSNNNCNAIINSKTNELVAGCKNSVIPNYITSIGDGSFSGCSGLTSITIPNSVTSIGTSAFLNCTSLTSVTIPNSVNSIPHQAFFGCSALSSITIPNSVTYIGYSAFGNCFGLTSVTIPNSVTSIGQSAFSQCINLTSVTIPNSITSIGSTAFWNCYRLTSVTSYITGVFETGTRCFEGIRNATLYVPKGLMSKYQSTVDWNRFTNIEEIPGIDMPMACNDLGKVLINGYIEFSNKVGKATVYDGGETTFVFTPNDGCKLKQVLINGLDVTRSVKDNKLTTTILNGSTINVVFANNDGDLNDDGFVNITDVVALVNMILGK